VGDHGETIRALREDYEREVRRRAGARKAAATRRERAEAEREEYARTTYVVRDADGEPRMSFGVGEPENATLDEVLAEIAAWWDGTPEGYLVLEDRPHDVDQVVTLGHRVVALVRRGEGGAMTVTRFDEVDEALRKAAGAR
jgi:hypothetical protein